MIAVLYDCLAKRGMGQHGFQKEVLSEVFLSLVPLHPKRSESAVTLETMLLHPFIGRGRFSYHTVPEISYHKGCKFTMKKIYLDISGLYFAKHNRLKERREY